MRTSFLTNNYAFLNRNFNGPGIKIHCAEQNEEFVTFTCAPCKSNDHDFEIVPNNNEICFRVIIGNSEISLIRKITRGEEFTFRNLPVTNGQEIWVACDVPNTYCVYGFASNYPLT